MESWLQNIGIISGVMLGIYGAYNAWRANRRIDAQNEPSVFNRSIEKVSEEELIIKFSVRNPLNTAITLLSAKGLTTPLSSDTLPLYDIDDKIKEGGSFQMKISGANPNARYSDQVEINKTIIPLSTEEFSMRVRSTENVKISITYEFNHPYRGLIERKFFVEFRIPIDNSPPQD